MKIEEISKVIFIFSLNFSFSFSGDHVMRMRIKVVPVAGHLNADRDLGGRVTDLEYHGQIATSICICILFLFVFLSVFVFAVCLYR